MEYFAGLDVSMAETHVCVVTRDGAVMHEAKVHLPIWQPCSRKDRPSASAVRNRPDGTNALPWLEPARITRGLRR